MGDDDDDDDGVSNGDIERTKHRPVRSSFLLTETQSSRLLFWWPAGHAVAGADVGILVVFVVYVTPFLWTGIN